MTITEANYWYRQEVAKAISSYRAELRLVFAAHSRPIPLTRQASLDMLEVWDDFKGEIRLADSRRRLRVLGWR